MTWTRTTPRPAFPPAPGARPARSRCGRLGRQDRTPSPREVAGGAGRPRLFADAGGSRRLHQEFRERLALAEGDVGRLVAEARREIRRITSESAWRDGWSGDGHTPDYDPIRHRFERLVELGHADEVVSLGREFIERGHAPDRPVRRRGGDGDRLRRLPADRLPGRRPVEPLLARSPAPRHRRRAGRRLRRHRRRPAAPVLDGPASPEDWSDGGRHPGRPPQGEACRRRDRRRPVPPRLTSATGSPTGSPTPWSTPAEAASCRTLYEAEARAHRQLRAARRLPDRGPRVSTRPSAGPARGSPRPLRSTRASPATWRRALREIARSRKRWDVVAAHAAADFFDQPRRLHVRRADQGRPQGQGRGPRPRGGPALPRDRRTRRSGSCPPKPPAGKLDGPRRPPVGDAPAGAPTPPPEPGPPAPPLLEVDPDWPLPIPEELASRCSIVAGGTIREPRPRLRRACSTWPSPRSGPTRCSAGTTRCSSQPKRAGSYSGPGPLVRRSRRGRRQDGHPERSLSTSIPMP